MRKILKWILVIIWMIVIFSFSSETGDESSSRSRSFILDSVNIVDNIFDLDISDSNKEEIIDNLHFIVRKVAHFTIYLILGILVFLSFIEYHISFRNIIIYSILFCFIYSITDEFHQLFIIGRSGEAIDCLVDTLGSCCGIFICYIINKRDCKFYHDNL